MKKYRYKGKNIHLDGPIDDIQGSIYSDYTILVEGERISLKEFERQFGEFRAAIENILGKPVENIIDKKDKLNMIKKNLAIAISESAHPNTPIMPYAVETILDEMGLNYNQGVVKLYPKVVEHLVGKIPYREQIRELKQEVSTRFARSLMEYGKYVKKPKTQGGKIKFTIEAPIGLIPYILEGFTEIK